MDMNAERSEGDCIVEIEELCGELWRACAGNQLLHIPKNGDRVYYFPQGHIEHEQPYPNQEEPTNDLPPKIHCLVVNVGLSVEAETDEVVVGFTLLPCNEELFVPVAAPDNMNGPLCFYGKTLTASDISGDVGIALSACFVDESLPPLDMSKDPPAQIIVMKDLHGHRWHFLHVYHAELKQHLLTTGWSKFVAAKKLTEGDKIIYLRAENGELRIGIRRAMSSQRTIITTSVVSDKSVERAIMTSGAHAVNSHTMFHIYYRPWESNLCFLVPVDRYNRSMEEEYPIGARFKMLVEDKDCVEQRFALGTVVGVDPLDPVRWPNSAWRRLKVNWDAPLVMDQQQERVNPWDVELLSPRRKKSRRDVPLVARFPSNWVALFVLAILVFLIILIYIQVGLRKESFK